MTSKKECSALTLAEIRKLPSYHLINGRSKMNKEELCSEIGKLKRQNIVCKENAKGEIWCKSTKPKNRDLARNQKKALISKKTQSQGKA